MPAPGSRSRHAALEAPAPAPTTTPATLTTIDLHAHTRRSDGVMEPADLVRAAAMAGVRLFALTDHDTLAGYREVAAGGSLPPGLELVPGVEINAVVGRSLELRENEVHVLGFGVDPADEMFEATLAVQRSARRVRFERMLARLRDLDMPIDDVIEAEGMIASGLTESLGRPTVARALLAKGHVTSVEDAFERYLSHGRPAHVARDGLRPKEAIAAIRQAGGLPVLAHFSEAPQRQDLVRELMDVGLGGLEVYYRSFDEPTVAAMAEVARRLGLVATGGTDYHGDLGTYAGAHAAIRVPRAVAGPFRRAVAAAAGGAHP